MKMQFGKFMTCLLSLGMVAAFAGCTKPEGPTVPDDGGDEPEVVAVADFSYKAEGLKVTFTNTSTDAVKYKWDFGDDETSTEKDPVHTYFAGGTYKVSLRATSQDDLYDVKTVDITVAAAAKAVFTYTAGFGSLVNFDARASENVDPKTAEWDFGDGKKESGSVEVAHEFPGDGTYTVTLAIKDQNGNAVTPYSTQVVVAGDYNLIKGSSMEADDAKYWKFTYKYENSVNAQMEYEFGYTQDKPKDGHNGCFALKSWPEPWLDNSTRFFMYQTVDVEAGKTYKLSVAAKTGQYTGSGVAFRFYFLQHKDEYMDKDGHPMFKGAGVPAKEANWFDHWGNGVPPGKTNDLGDPATPRDEVYTYNYTATETGKLHVAFDAYWVECAVDAPWLLDDFKFELVPGSGAGE